MDSDPGPSADAVYGSGSGGAGGGGGGVTIATWLAGDVTQRRLGFFLAGVSATESSSSQRSTTSGRTATSQKFLG